MLMLLTTGHTWQRFVWDLAVYIPHLFAWCVVLVFCFIRRRENPRGAMYLSLAILLQLSWFALRYGIPFIYSQIDFYDQQFFAIVYPTYFFITINTLTYVPSWILIAMAVFARPTHYDYVGSSAFDGDSS